MTVASGRNIKGVLSTIQKKMKHCEGSMLEMQKVSQKI